MQIEESVSLDFDDVLIKPKRSILQSRSEVDLTRTFKFKHSKQEWTGVPIIAANMDTVGTFEMAKSLAEYGMCTALHKHYSAEELRGFNAPTDRVFYSLGMREEDYEKFKHNDKLYRMICIDVPSAYLEKFVDFLKRVRNNHPDHTIMAGNVCTGEMAEALVLAGADIVKVGVGPGSGCLTRRVAGVGVPQLTAIIECADAAHGLKGLVCGDGGIVHPGDLGKAFGAGADFVMMGGVFSGHDECGGELLDPYSRTSYGFPSYKTHELIGKAKMKFYGMASAEAMDKYYGGRAKHRAAEGRVTLVPYKGPVAETVETYLGGLRSTMTYIGAERLKEVSKRTTFVRVNRILNTSLA